MNRSRCTMLTRAAPRRAGGQALRHGEPASVPPEPSCHAWTDRSASCVAGSAKSEREAPL